MTLDEIADLAEAVAQEHCPGRAEVDPFIIAKKLDIPVLPGDYKGAFDGLLEWRDGRFIIYYDSTRLGGPNRPRVRFTVAHEIGHWYIDEHRESLEAGIAPHKSWTDFTSTNPIEREADFFAANLLMPRQRFRDCAWDMTPELGNILRLADVFNVSRTSVVVRYLQADFYGCAVVVVKPSGEVSWSWTSRTLGDRIYATVVERLPRQARASFDRLNEAVADRSFGIKSGPVNASTWFVYAQDERDEELLEEMISLGSHGVLVFLSTEQ